MIIILNWVFFFLNIRDFGFKGDKCILFNLNKKEIYWIDVRVLLIVFMVGSFGLGKKLGIKIVLLDLRIKCIGNF